MMKQAKPELLCPAGSPEKLRYAFAYGADAVYAGVPVFSLRARDNGFDWENLTESVRYARGLGKKVYLTANVFARNAKINLFDRQLEQLAAVKPDALIMGDPGLIAMVKEKYPEIPIHLSVQANCMNWQAVKFWKSVGIERVILSRELRLEEIKAIKDHVPDMELEAFVHGSICIAYSGRCLLSRYMSYRDANQGICDNSCRYPMKLHAEKRHEPRPDTDYFVEDARNPGEMYRIDEDENGTYIMNAKDLRLIEYLREIIDAGVCSLKIEGRTKSLFYLSVVTRAYRQAIDDLYGGKDFDNGLMTELERITRRGYHSGFLFERNTPGELYDKSMRGQDHSGFVAQVLGTIDAGQGLYKIDTKGQLEVGQSYEVFAPQGVTTIEVDELALPDGSRLPKVHAGRREVVLRVKPGAAPLPEFSLVRKPFSMAEVEA